MSADERLRARLRDLVAISDARASHGMQVLVSNPGTFGTTAEMHGRIDRALGLVAAHQPWRMRRIRRDMRLIWVKRLPSFRAAYMYELGACQLDTYFVMTFPAEEVAASIVHEAVHARVGRLEVPRERAREERLCRRAEASFGRTLPNGATVLARALAALHASDDEVAPVIDWREVERLRTRTAFEEQRRGQAHHGGGPDA